MLSIHGLVTHHMNLDDALCAGSPVSYVFGSNGVMVIHRTSFGRFGVLSAGIDVPGLSHLPPYLIDWSVPLIPFDLFISAVSTLKIAYKKYKAESLVFICYDQNRGGYFLHVPMQEITTTSVDYKLDVPSEQVIMHIHSHPGNLNTFSGVDDHDETNAGFYAVLSDMSASWPAFTLSLCVAHNRVILDDYSDLTQVFDLPWSSEPWPQLLAAIKPKVAAFSTACSRSYHRELSASDNFDLYDDDVYYKLYREEEL